MLGHISFGVESLKRAASFYDAALTPLGFVRVWNEAHAGGCGASGGPDRLALFAMPGEARSPGPDFHSAFPVPSRAAVGALHRSALDAGAPGPRPRYSPTYYAAFVIDPDRVKLEAVHQ